MQRHRIGKYADGASAMKDICSLLDVGCDPISTFQEFAEIAGTDLTGAPIEAGFPVASWHWDQMNQADFQRLLDFQGNVYLHTRLNTGQSGYIFRTYSAVLARPTSAEYSGQNRLDVNLNFVMLELVVANDFFY